MPVCLIVITFIHANFAIFINTEVQFFLCMQMYVAKLNVSNSKAPPKRCYGRLTVAPLVTVMLEYLWQ